jgi:hypothetical protein
MDVWGFGPSTWGTVIGVFVVLAGVIVTFWNPESRRGRWSYVALFTFVGIASIVLARVQERHTQRAELEGAEAQKRAEEAQRRVEQLLTDLNRQTAEIKRQSERPIEAIVRLPEIQIASPSPARAKATAAPSPSPVVRRWELTSNEIGLVAQRMRPYAGRNLSLVYVIGSDASSRFAHHFDTAFMAAGWKNQGGIAAGAFKSAPYGLLLVIHDPEDQKRESPLRAFAFALNEIGISPTAEVDKAVAEGEFKLIVGLPPQ